MSLNKTKYFRSAATEKPWSEDLATIIVAGDDVWNIETCFKKWNALLFVRNNIQATISAVWLAENMSINPKLVNSAISPVQKSEIECKTVKLSAKIVKLKMTDSSDKIELGQTKWRTNVRRRLKLFT